MLQAKPVVPDQYWILRDHDRKIGNIEAEAGGYVVSINGQKTHFQNLDSLVERIPIWFDVLKISDVKPDPMQVHGYPTSSPAYNAVFDVSNQLPLWTREPKSRSWLAAGWYRVKSHRSWRLVFCPKLILLQRYQHQGPYHTRAEAMSK